jgi:hypothetical protein
VLRLGVQFSFLLFHLVANLGQLLIAFHINVFFEPRTLSL